MSAIDENTPKKFLRLRPRTRGQEAARWPAPQRPVTDPREILAANLQQEQRSGLFQVKRAKRRLGRRIFDFLLLLAFGDGAGVGFLWWFQANAATMLIVGVGMLFYTVALAWFMFTHLDEY